MEDKKNNKPHISKGSFIFCILIGIVAFIFCISSNANNKKSLAEFIEIQATVTSTDPKILIAYNYDNSEYKDVEILLAHTPKVNDQITVYIAKDDYSLVVSNEFSIAIMKTVLILGIVFFVAGLIGLILRKILMRGVDPIIEAGQYVYADLDQVVYETSVSDSEGRHPYFIYCHYSDFKGEKRQDYVSPPIYTDPYPYLAANKNHIKIYIKGKNIKKYSFDVSMFEKKA